MSDRSSGVGHPSGGAANAGAASDPSVRPKVTAAARVNRRERAEFVSIVIAPKPTVRAGRTLRVS